MKYSENGKGGTWFYTCHDVTGRVRVRSFNGDAFQFNEFLLDLDAQGSESIIWDETELPQDGDLMALLQEKNDVIDSLLKRELGEEA